MKDKNIIKTLLLSLFLFLFPILNVKAADDFEFSNVDIVVDVDEKGVFTVTETFDVDFFQSRHGIYVDIPIQYNDFKWTYDGKTYTRDYYWPISDSMVLSEHESEIIRENNYERFKIGSSDSYANPHEQYKITYKVHSSDLDLDGKQLFYYNLVGSKWNNDIKNATFTVNMPKEFDTSKIYFYTDGKKVDPRLTYNVDGNTITGHLDTTINKGRGITIEIKLPDNYFDFSKDYLLTYVASFGLLAIMSVLIFFWLIVYGIDDKVIVTVEFEPFDNFNSADIGYILNTSVTNKEIASLFIYWANKGLITIEQGENDLTFTKVKEIDVNAKKYEKVFFDKIFSDTSIKSSDLNEEFAIYSKARRLLKKTFKGKKALFFSGANNLKKIGILFATLPIAIFCTSTNYIRTYDFSGSLFIFLLVYFGITQLGFMFSDTVKKFKNENAFEKFKNFLLIIILLVVLYLYVSALLGDSSINESNYNILWLVTIIDVIMASFIQKRTKYGTYVTGRAVGFKEFIQYAEKDKLNAMFNDNPNLYFDILPYAYVMDLSTVWAEHFNDMEIVAPNWYTGDSFDYTDFNTGLNSGLNTASYVSSGSSSSGGSSGGGFGGSSGGSW